MDCFARKDPYLELKRDLENINALAFSGQKKRFKEFCIESESDCLLHVSGACRQRQRYDFLRDYEMGQTSNNLVIVSLVPMAKNFAPFLCFPPGDGAASLVLLQQQQQQGQHHPRRRSWVRRFPAPTFQATFTRPAPDSLQVFLRGALRTKVDNDGANIMVALSENGLVTDCPRGENKGRVLSNDYVVRKLEKLCTVKDITAKKTVSGTCDIIDTKKRLNLALDLVKSERNKERIYNIVHLHGASGLLLLDFEIMAYLKRVLRSCGPGKAQVAYGPNYVHVRIT
ncbi:hypothetical protein JHK85_017051 [Glycine max]|nr:hypothetical protein JHK85_017051 [Glycine max]